MDAAFCISYLERIADHSVRPQQDGVSISNGKAERMTGLKYSICKRKQLIEFRNNVRSAQPSSTSFLSPDTIVQV